MPFTQVFEGETEEPVGSAPDPRESFERIPTGVADFDSIINGGLPAGSVVLLIGDIGGGQHEFAYTSASKIARTLEEPENKVNILGDTGARGKIPGKVCYVSVSRSREDIMAEVRSSFNREHFHDVLEKRLVFKDLSALFFKNTSVPSSWTGAASIFETGSRPAQGDLLTDLNAFLDENGHDALVVIDSLTHLAESGAIPMRDLQMALRGLQRVAKRWGGLIYVLLTEDVLDKKDQQMIVDAVDGVIRFKWSKNIMNSRRVRYMYVEKFMAILPHIDGERISRFTTIVNDIDGMLVVKTEKIS